MLTKIPTRGELNRQDGCLRHELAALLPRLPVGLSARSVDRMWFDPEPYPILWAITSSALLAELGHPTLVYTQDYDSRLSQFVTSRLTIVRNRLDIRAVGASCKLAILNGNAGTSTELLLAGVPQLLLPLTLEQEVYSRRVADLGAGVMADGGQPTQVAARLFRMLQGSRYADGAQAFRARHSGFNSQDSISR